MKFARFIFLPILFLPCAAVSFVVHPESKYKKGAVINFTVISEAGVVLRDQHEVVSEVKSGEVTTLNVRRIMFDGAEASEPMWHKLYYDADHWAIDVSNGMSPSLVGLEGASVAEFSDSLVFPYNMKIGDTLRPARSYTKLTRKGEFWESSLFYYNRKVMEHDTISCSLEKIPTLRIEYKLSEHTIRKLNLLGDKDEVDLHYCTIWFSVEYGIVQREVTTKFGTVKTTLQSIK